MGEYKLREWMEEREKLNNDSGKNSSVSKDESKIVSTGKSMAQAILAITGGKYDLVTEVPSAFMLPRSHQKNSFGWLIISGHDRACWLAVRYPPSLILHQQIPFC